MVVDALHWITMAGFFVDLSRTKLTDTRDFNRVFCASLSFFCVWGAI